VRATQGSNSLTAHRIRLAFVPASLLSLILAGGFFAQVEWATTLWPWPAAPLSYVFIGSILAAIAIPMLWIAVSGEPAAIQAGAIDLAVMYGGMFVYVLTLLGDPGQPTLWPYAVVFGLACAGSTAAFVYSRRIPWRDGRPMPPPVRASFATFAVILVGVGTALLFHADIFPWHLGPESSVMFGLIYLGAAVYFVHGVLVPHWSNAAGQLAGFLAYDVVLLAPFLEHFKVAHGGARTSLIIYVVFLLYSGALAGYYLFVEDSTRLTG
jgi:hypothetical protein